jgi:hypothetical protein
MAIETGQNIGNLDFTTTVKGAIVTACRLARDFGLGIDDPPSSLDPEYPIYGNRIIYKNSHNILINKYNELILAANNKDNSLVKPLIASGDIITAQLWEDILINLVGDSANGIPAILFGVPSGGIFITAGTEVKESGYLKLYLNKQIDENNVVPATSPVTWSLGVGSVGTITGTTYMGTYRAVEVTGDASVTINASWVDPADQVTKTASHNVTVKETTIDSITVELLNRTFLGTAEETGVNSNVVFFSWNEDFIYENWHTKVAGGEYTLSTDHIIDISVPRDANITFPEVIESVKVDMYLKDPPTEINELETSLYYLVKAVPLNGDPYIISPKSVSTGYQTGAYGDSTVTSTTEYPGYEGYPVTEVNTINISRGEFGILEVTFRYTGCADIKKTMKVWNKESVRLVEIVAPTFETKNNNDGYYEDTIAFTFSMEVELNDDTTFTKQEGMIWSIVSDPSGTQSINSTTGEFTPGAVTGDTLVTIRGQFVHTTGVSQSDELSFYIFNRAVITGIDIVDNTYGETSTYEVLENRTLQLYAMVRYDDNTSFNATSSTDTEWRIENPDGLTTIDVADGLFSVGPVSSDKHPVISVNYKGWQSGGTYPNVTMNVLNISDVTIADNLGATGASTTIDEGGSYGFVAYAVTSSGSVDITSQCNWDFVNFNNPASVVTHPFASINDIGEINVGNISGDEQVRVRIQYQSGETTWEEFKVINLVDKNILSSIVISGQSLVQENGTYQYNVEATLDDLSKFDVAPDDPNLTWTITSYGGLPSNLVNLSDGLLVVSELSTTGTITIQASYSRTAYTGQVITKTDTQNVTVSDILTLDSVEVQSVADTVQSGSTTMCNLWATWSDGSQTKLTQNVTWSVLDKNGTTSSIASDGTFTASGVPSNNTSVIVKGLYTGDGYNVSDTLSINTTLPYWYTYNPTSFNINGPSVECIQDYSLGYKIMFMHDIPISSPRYFEFTFNSPSTDNMYIHSASDYSNLTNETVYFEPNGSYSNMTIGSISYGGTTYVRTWNMNNNSLAAYLHYMYYKITSFPTNRLNQTIGIAVYADCIWVCINGDWGIVVDASSGITANYSYVASGIPNINNLQYAASNEFRKYILFKMRVGAAITLNSYGTTTPFKYKPSGFLAWST